MGERLIAKGVSEYIATFIVSIVTLAAGLGVFIYAYTVIDSHQLAISRSIEYARAEYKEDLDIMAGYIKGGEAVIIIVTGGSSVDIDAVYVNNTMIVCRIYVNDAMHIIDGEGAARVPSNSVAVIKCPVEGAVAYVKIVYRGGEVGLWAARIA